MGCEEGSEKKKKEKQETKAKRVRATSHGIDRKGLGEPRQGKRMITNDFQNGRTGFRPNKKEKGKEEDARNGDAEKGIPQHISKKMANQELSKESELKEGKNEKKGKWDLPR